MEMGDTSIKMGFLPGFNPEDGTVGGAVVEGSRTSLVRKLFVGDVTWLFIALIVGVLMLENWLFHRHAVY